MSENQLIIDTDVGVDDALAILLALSNPSKCKVVAITCVAGNVGLSTVYTNVLRLLNFCGQVQNIPVYMGCKTALIHHATPFHENAHPPHGHDGFGGVAEDFPLPKDDLEVPSDHAAVAMTHIVARHPGAVTLVALGPLTNVAIAQRLDPNFLPNLKELVVMGGTVEGKGNEHPAAEFNFACDPEAASIVLSEQECKTRLVPYETCLKHSLDWDSYREWTSCGTKNSDFVKKITAQSAEWRRDTLKRHGYTSCDLQAMATVLDPSVTLRSESYPAWVELHGATTRGMLVLDQRPSYRWHNKVPHIKLQLEFDEKLLKEMFMRMVL
ncbi:inosine-uridine preferring nucleoside hydrolase-like [Ornithodoros turicata]|uniref:inosine-uridine preferring nucleoside hydrolase-like n=1 Tax=Ornithodoros turicata TaxID=34597 RepID=UPI00313991CA